MAGERRPFVGRQREIRSLRQALAAARAGRGAFVVLLGEPGIGKTRTLEELAAGARKHADVLWGRCREVGDLPAYWPWVQVLRAHAASRSPEKLRDEFGAGTADVARLVPSLAPVLGAPPAGPPLDPAEARLRLFHGIATLLRNASRTRPVLVILDDVHWADEASLHLLRLLVGELADARVLIAAACRDAELRRDPELTRMVGELVTVGERLPLGPLAEAEVGDLIAAVAGGAAPAPVVSAVHQRTSGNPLFVNEVTRLLLADGALGDADPRRWRIPEGVRAAIRHRLAALSAADRDVLAVAAVVGREFAVDVVERAAGLPAGRALDLLDEPRSLGMVQPVPDAPRRLRFSHVLVRDTLYDDLPASRRAALHARVGDAMAATYAADLGPHVAAIAYQYLEAGAAADPARAIDFATRAGDRALAQLAHEEAAAHYQAALDALARGDDDPARRTALLLARGEAERSSGDRPRARATFQLAAALARERGAATDLARAALGFAGVWIHQLMVDPDNVTVLDEALAVLDESEPALRARLLARLSMEIYYSPEVDRCTELSVEAVRLARTTDPHTLAFALHALNWALWRPGRLAERRTAAAEMVAAAERSGSPELLAESLAWRVRAELDAGNMDVVDAAIAAHDRPATDTRRPLFLWRAVQWRITRATMAGRFAEAERLLPKALETAAAAAERSQYYLAILYYTWDLHCLRREQGRAAEVLGEVGHLIEPFAMLQSVRSSMSEPLLAAGRHEEAARILEELGIDDFGRLPRDVTFVRDATLLAEVAVETADRPRAARLYDLLAPAAPCHVALGAIGYMGPLDRHLGRLAALLERLDDAVAHLERALAACERAGARPQLARSQQDLAAVLERRAAGGDVARARALRETALATADELGMHGLAAELRPVAGEPPATLHVLASHRGRHGAAAVAVVPAGERVFRREGEFWTLGFDGATVRVADAKGLRQLARLLAHPRTPQHALDLAADQTDGVEPSRADRGDAGEVLDARARQAYRERLRDAHEELEEARRHGDLGRVGRAEHEIEALGRELERAFGLDGRTRRAGSAVERARVAVVRTIGRAIDRIASVHPALAHHLRTNVTTGTVCSYDPGPGSPPRWITG